MNGNIFKYNNKLYKVLSIKQPAASLIADGYKNIENRTWATKYTGWVLIHSSATFETKECLDKSKPAIKKILNSIDYKKFPTSAILGAMYITHTESPCDIEKYLWATGPVCWHINKVIKFDTPIPAKGQLGLWNPYIFLHNDIKKQLDLYYIKKYCDTLNIKYLEHLEKDSLQNIKILIKYIKDHYYNKVKNVTAFHIIYNFFYYKIPSVGYGNDNNIWNKSNGFIATYLDINDSDIFEKQLLKSANNWFHYNIQKQDEKQEGKHKQEYNKLREIDLSNIKTLKNIFDSNWRKNNLTKTQNIIVRKALDGGGNAQFHPYKGWRLSGFGIWTYIKGSDYVLRKALPEVLKQYKLLYKGKIYPHALPHLIFKPPSEKGGELEPHNDSGTWCEMYHRATNCQTIKQWVDTYGLMTLAHLKGAGHKEGGQTTCLGPMDTHTYLIILQMIHPKTPHPDMPLPNKNTNWNIEWITAYGPKFYMWYKKPILIILNRVLKFLKSGTEPKTDNDKKWIQLLRDNGYYDLITTRALKSPYKELKKINMIPLEYKNKPYMIAWADGFIHGSNATGNTPRLTFTVPFGPVGDKNKINRAIKRLYNISNNIKDVLLDKEPYHGGIVHSQNKTEIEIYPFFKDLYIKKDDIKKFETII